MEFANFDDLQNLLQVSQSKVLVLQYRNCNRDEFGWCIRKVMKGNRVYCNLKLNYLSQIIQMVILYLF